MINVQKVHESKRSSKIQLEPDTWIEEESWWKYHDKQYDLQQSTRVGKLKCQDGQSKEYTVASNAADCADVRR